MCSISITKRKITVLSTNQLVFVERCLKFSYKINSQERRYDDNCQTNNSPHPINGISFVVQIHAVQIRECDQVQHYERHADFFDDLFVY